MNRYFFLIFIILGIGGLIGSAVMANGLLDFLNRAVKTEATIVDIVRVQVDDGYTQFPVFQFFDLNGVEVLARGNTDFSSYAIGQELEIYYDPEYPSGGVTQESLAMWGPTAILLVFGLCFIGVGSIFFLKADELEIMY